MKNRSWVCYALDFIGVSALIGATIALAAAFWFAGSAAEGVALVTFKYCLVGAVSTFILARLCEIARVFQTTTASVETPAATLPNNVESLPDRLPRAA